MVQVERHNSLCSLLWRARTLARDMRQCYKTKPMFSRLLLLSSCNWDGGEYSSLSSTLSSTDNKQIEDWRSNQIVNLPNHCGAELLLQGGCSIQPCTVQLTTPKRSMLVCLSLRGRAWSAAKTKAKLMHLCRRPRPRLKTKVIFCRLLSFLARCRHEISVFLLDRHS